MDTNEMVEIFDSEHIDLGMCLSQTTIAFFEDGSATLTLVAPGVDLPLNYEDCETGTASIQWEYLGNNKFRFIPVNEASEISEVVFFENYTVLAVIEKDGILTKTIYIKIE